MKTKLSLLTIAIATIFSSCSKQTLFTNSNQNYGGFHKTEQVAVANTQTAEELPVAASVTSEPAIITQTPSFTAPKAAKATVATSTEETTAAVAPAAMSKAEVKAAVKAAKKEIKKDTKGLMADGKSQILAAVLAFFLGGLSIHRFYLGYTGLAFLQIFTVLLFGLGLIWVLIDFVRILTGNLKPKDGDYADKI